VCSLPAGRSAGVLRGWSPPLEHAISAIARDGTSVIHNHGLWLFPNLYARRAALAAGIPLVISPRGMLDEWALRRSPVRKFFAWNLFERKNLASAKLYHATSEAEASSIRAAGFTQPIAMIPNGVDVPESVRDVPRSLLEGKFAMLSGRRWLLFMSRLHPKKGLMELVQTWQALAPRFPDWHLLIAGPELDDHGAHVRNLVQRLGLADKTTFAGMLQGKEKDCALSQSELLVLPTRSENFGIVVVEALAHATPVMTTRAAPWEELRREECGWWIEAGAESLHAGLSQALATAPEQLRAMGARGRSLAIGRYSWRQAGKDMKEAYLWIRGAGSRPSCIRV
jgi:glycosyltransferase involved in cell wall biosynthesis